MKKQTIAGILSFISMVLLIRTMAFYAGEFGNVLSILVPILFVANLYSAIACWVAAITGRDITV